MAAASKTPGADVNNSLWEANAVTKWILCCTKVLTLVQAPVSFATNCRKQKPQID